MIPICVGGAEKAVDTESEMVGHPIIPGGGTTYESWCLSSCTADKLLNMLTIVANRADDDW
jgi:hypothetical protein